MINSNKVGELVSQLDDSIIGVINDQLMGWKHGYVPK